MKEKLIRQIQHGMLGVLDQRQQEMLKAVLSRCLDDYNVEELQHSNYEKVENKRYLDMFIAAKRVEGCSEKTIIYYSTTINKFLNSTDKDIRDILTDDIRTYLSDYQEKNSSSKVTMDNMRRIFSSFFTWLEDEDYIVKSPVRRIHKVKTANIIKVSFNRIKFDTQICDMALSFCINQLFDENFPVDQRNNLTFVQMFAHYKSQVLAMIANTNYDVGF